MMGETKPIGNIGYVIREVRESELLDVMNINRVCLPENYTYSFFHSIFASWPKAFLVAELEGSIVGYIMCRVERTFSKLEPLRLRKAGHIVSIAVMPKHRGLGLGKSLLVGAMKSLKDYYGCDEVFLEVRVSNVPAITLYKSLGFSIVGTAHRYYVDGEDAYVMARKL